MVRKRRTIPEIGELVIATVKVVFDKGAYVTLDEYPTVDGYVPIGEVSSSWVHNIRDFLKEGRKTVLKVIRVDQAKKHVDLSLRRVNEKERREKLLEWKRAQRAEKLLELAAKRLGKTLDDAYISAGWIMEDAFGEIFTGFEEAAAKGVKPLLKAGVPEEWAEVIAALAESYVELPEVKVSGILQLVSTAPDGILRIKKALIEALSSLRGFEVSCKIYSAGAPKYRIDIVAKNYHIAEAALNRLIKKALDTISSLNGTGSFTRL
ncbi:MAG: translation initiation factor IF-2 subunit alpha [Candidatus Verstraetearchaeota archaeon]|nr:translation initiation factor IF-2 subunit alpha [Candidatus Verstraetearchaeota archaeon]